jgi:hypothetical protein
VAGETEIELVVAPVLQI